MVASTGADATEPVHASTDADNDALSDEEDKIFLLKLLEVVSLESDDTADASRTYACITRGTFSAEEGDSHTQTAPAAGG